MLDLTNKQVQIKVGNDWIDIPIVYLAQNDIFKIIGSDIEYIANSYVNEDNGIYSIKIKK